MFYIWFFYQELGESNSSYSLSEQLKLNPVFKKENFQMPTFEEIEAYIGKMRRDWKVSSNILLYILLYMIAIVGILKIVYAYLNLGTTLYVAPSDNKQKPT